VSNAGKGPFIGGISEVIMQTSTSTTRHLKADVNVTPMIDILLVLLIIFMVISPTHSMGLDSQVPRLDPDLPAKDSEEALVLSIGEDLSVAINQELVKNEVLSARLGGILRSRTDRTVFVQAAPELAFEVVAAIIDLLKEAGAERIGIMTRNLPHSRQK
jgi:biopolymer transport protein TolR